jgi:hypothetical protein
MAFVSALNGPSCCFSNKLFVQQVKQAGHLALCCCNTVALQDLSSAHSMDLGSAGGVSLMAAAAAAGSASPVWFCGTVLPDNAHTGRRKLLQLQRSASWHMPTPHLHLLCLGM